MTVSQRNCSSVSCRVSRLDTLALTWEEHQPRRRKAETTLFQELGHFLGSGSTPPPSVTSASKAVDCAVISTRGNMTTRPTAQNTTSASGWSPLWLHCPTEASLRCVSVRPVPVRVKAHDGRGVRKNPQENERKKPTQRWARTRLSHMSSVTVTYGSRPAAWRRRRHPPTSTGGFKAQPDIRNQHFHVDSILWKCSIYVQTRITSQINVTIWK